MEKTYLQSDLNVASKINVNSGFTRRLSLRMGKIKSYNPDDNTIDLDWIFPMKGGMDKLELNRPYVGFRSGIHYAPEVGSVIIVGFVEDLPILLTYSLPSEFSKMLQGLNNNAGVTTRIRKLQEGEISLNSVQNSEIYLSNTITIQDKTQDKIIINPEDGSINLDSLQFYVNNEAGSITMGMVERNGDIVTDDGQTVDSLNGGNALTELKFTVKQFADNTINNNDTVNANVAEVTIGTIVDDDGNKVKSSDNNDIQLEIKMSSGIKVQFDSKGNMFVNTTKLNINSGNEKIPNSTIGLSQQRSAREGDRITLPLTPLSSPNTTHPGLNEKSLFNITQLQNLAACFMTPMGPCTFIPVPDIKLVGEITQGSDSVFIGSIDKTKESTEISDNIKQ